MDEATALQILQRYGAPNNPQNMQRVLQQAPGSDGSAALGRSMGLQGGMDESGNALDKLAFASQRAPVAAPTAPVATTPMPTAPVASATTPTPIQPRQAMGPPEPTGVPEPTSVPMPTATAGSGDSPFLPWLLAASGIGSTTGREMMRPNTGGAAAATGQALIEGPEARARLTGPNAQKALPAPNKQLTGPAPVDIMGNVTGPTTLATEAVDKISAGTSNASESRRPINTNADERNSELVNKPTNLDTKAQRQGPYDGEPTNLVEEIAKFLKKSPKR